MFINYLLLYPWFIETSKTLKGKRCFDGAGLSNPMVLDGWIFAGSVIVTTGVLMLGTDWLAGGASVSAGWWFGVDWFSFDCGNILGDITGWGVVDWWGVGSGLLNLLFLKVTLPVAWHFTLYCLLGSLLIISAVFIHWGVLLFLGWCINTWVPMDSYGKVLAVLLYLVRISSFLLANAFSCSSADMIHSWCSS